MFIERLCLFLKWVFLLLLHCKSSLYSKYKTIIRYMLSKLFLSFFGLSFYSFVPILGNTEVITFDNVHLPVFSLIVYVLVMCVYVCVCFTGNQTQGLAYAK